MKTVRHIDAIKRCRSMCNLPWLPKKQVCANEYTAGRDHVQHMRHNNFHIVVCELLPEDIILLLELCYFGATCIMLSNEFKSLMIR